MDKKQKQRDAYLLSSVDHSLQILDLLMVRDGLRLKEIAELLHLDVSSAFKMLYTLNHRGYVFKDEHNRYHLGNKLAPVRQIAVVRHHIAEVARPYILHLWARTQKTVLLGTLGNDRQLSIVSIRAEKNQSSIVGRPGARMNLHTTGLGKVLLAFQPEDVRNSVLAGYTLIERTAYTITDPDEFGACLETCREQKWAAAYEENHLGHCDLAVPLFDYTGSCVAAIAIVTDAESMEENQPLYLKYLQNAGHAVSDQLGYDTFLSNNT